MPESLQEYPEYDYSGGLDTETPDEHKPRPRHYQAVHMPYVRNVRVYAASSVTTRVPVSTRKGAGFYMVPIGQTLDAQQASTTGNVTNLITNPSFETNTTGWSGYATGVISQSATQAQSGTSSLSVVTSGGAARGTTSGFITASPSVAQTLSLYVFAAAGVTVAVDLDHYNSGVYVAGTYGNTVAGNGGWQRLTITFTAGATINQITITASTVSATTFYLDAIMFELGSSASAYFDGATTDTDVYDYAWTGTAHASTSTRTTNQSFGLINYRGAKFTATATGRLTRVDLRLKTAVVAGTGPVIVEIRSDVSGSPGVVLAQSSIPPSSITATATYLPARFVEAPQVTNTTAYWIVVYIQNDGTNTYLWSSTTAATTSKASANSGGTWTTTAFDLNFKTYISTDSPALGLARAYRSGGTPSTLIAHGTSLYSVNDNTGATTAISTGLTGTATDYYFEYANDRVFYVNGKDAPRQWDFTTDSVAGGTPGVSSLIILHKARLWYVNISDPALVKFTDSTDFTTIGGTSFLYIPTPKSTDPIKSMFIAQDNLVFATRQTKYILYGNDLASFVLRKAVSTVGTVSHNTVAEYKGQHYFLSDDGVYVFNGSFDRKISERADGSGITREINAIADKTKACATIWNGQYRLYYPSSGSGVNNRCLVYEIEKDSWWMDDNVYVSRTVNWSKTPDSNQLLEGSSLVGSAYYAEQGFDDLGRAIDFEMRLHYNPFGQPAALKRVKKYRPEFRSTSGNYSIDCQYDKDYADAPISNLIPLQGAGYLLGAATPLLGAIMLGKSNLIKGRISVSGKFSYLQFRYKCFGVNKPVEIIGSTSMYQVGRVK